MRSFFAESSVTSSTAYDGLNKTDLGKGGRLSQRLGLRPFGEGRHRLHMCLRTLGGRTTESCLSFEWLLRDQDPPPYLRRSLALKSDS